MITLKQSWADYLKYGRRLFFKKKSYIFQQGHIGTGFYYIYKGIVKIISDTPGGGKRILDFVGSGVLAGEIDHLPYFCSAVCHEDCVVYYFSEQDYHNLIQIHPEVTILFAESLILKEKLLLNNINVTSTSTESQIAQSLLYLMNSLESKEINLTQQELSFYTGLTRITIYKFLKIWASEGIVLISNRRIYIVDPKALKEIK
ncbi:Crp/Fnr family transcriptional regulator [Bacillus xiapuensis]|uniref:Crp/Fnr family transcriptional regulator n=1 Tax=Bacillus xiapuensis TaxID=2014075 RepID=A0ABU6N6Y7_9BACI|nr:Crp/Fnr family transcriptional regulator [Bacillus xiapuensis]